MLENLPDALGHALRDQRAGLDQIAFQRIDLRNGMGALDLESLAFVDHGPLPASCTADGPGLSPPLHWRGVPPAAATLLLIVEDADSPTPHPLVHAIVVALTPHDGALAEGVLDGDGDAAPGTDGNAASATGFRCGRNSYLQTGWLPPDPPPGHGVHRYAFQLFALEAGVEFSETPGREEVMEALRDHGLASACLIGTYERPDGSIRAGVGEAASNGPVAAA